MAITSIMRENLGTTQPLGKVTIDKRDGADEVLRKATMFIRRNLSKRETPLGEPEIKDILGYLFGIESKSIQLYKGLEDVPKLKGTEMYDGTLVPKLEMDFITGKPSKEELPRTEKEVREVLNVASRDKDSKSPHTVDDFIWARFNTDYHHSGEELVTVVIGQPNQFKTNRNGIILNYRGFEGFTYQINLDRLISLGVLVNMYKDIGTIGEDSYKDDHIRGFIHYMMPQDKGQRRRNHCYRVEPESYTDTKYIETREEVAELLIEGFKRSYQMELNIKSMEDYARNLGKTVATAFETKKNIPPKIQQAMKDSKFLNGKFGFVELDEDTDLAKYKVVEDYYLDIESRLPHVKVQSLRFRKLGKHRAGNSRATGLYSPMHHSIAVDLRQFDSFIHEYGHAIDYKFKEGEIQSMRYEFTDILNRYGELLPSKTTNLEYYLTPTEVFARGYEVAFRAKYPNLKTGLMGEEESYRKSPAHRPFYQDEWLYEQVIDYMSEYIK